MVMAVPHRQPNTTLVPVQQAAFFAITEMQNQGATGTVYVAVLDYWTSPWTVHFYTANFTNGVTSLIGTMAHSACGPYLVPYMRYNAQGMGFRVE